MNPERFKHIEMPMIEDVDDFTLSGEALETMGDKISSNIDSKIKEFQRDDTQRRVQQSKKENDDNEYTY